MRQLLTVALVLAFMALGATNVWAQGSGSNAASQLQRAQTAIAQFNRTHDERDIDGALRALGAAGSEHLSSADRTAVTNGYLALFGAIDRAMPKIPAGKTPRANIVPPKANGVQYPAGISPDSIADPAARARYEEEIRENEALTEEFLTAAVLREDDDRALLLFTDFTHEAFTRSDADQAALRGQIQGSDLTSARKQQLLKAVQ